MHPVSCCRFGHAALQEAVVGYEGVEASLELKKLQLSIGANFIKFPYCQNDSVG